jgi:anti-sigma B factor antagonist
VDLLTSAQLRSAVEHVVARRPAAVIVDLSAVTFLASADLQMLILMHEKLKPATLFAVVADGSATIRPIRLVKLDEVFPLYPALRDAQAALGLTGHSSCQSPS